MRSSRFHARKEKVKDQPGTTQRIIGLCSKDITESMGFHWPNWGQSGIKINNNSNGIK